MKKRNIKNFCTLLIFGITVFANTRFPSYYSSARQHEPISIYSSTRQHEPISIYSSTKQHEPISIY